MFKLLILRLIIKNSSSYLSEMLTDLTQFVTQEEYKTVNIGVNRCCMFEPHTQANDVL